MNVTIRRLHTVAPVCLIHYVFLRARSDKRDSARWLTDISVTDKSACLREFYRCTAAVYVDINPTFRTRVSHFDREARPLATSKTHQCQWSTPHPPADSFRFRALVSISSYRHVLRAYREYFSPRKRYRDGQEWNDCKILRSWFRLDR